MPEHAFVSFGAGPFSGSLVRIGREALDSGMFGGVHLRGPEDLGTDFWRDGMTHAKALRTRRGYWFMRWKPRIILDVFDTLEQGDTVMWVDAGCTINPGGADRMDEYRRMADRHPFGILAFQLPDSRSDLGYSADNVIAAIGPDPGDLETGQIITTAILFRVCRPARDLLVLWKSALEDHDLAGEVGCNRSGFVAHRHDQSVFSLLCKSRGVSAIPDETWAEDFSDPAMLRYPVWATRLTSSHLLLLRRTRSYPFAPSRASRPASASGTQLCSTVTSAGAYRAKSNTESISRSEPSVSTERKSRAPIPLRSRIVPSRWPSTLTVLPDRLW